MDEIKQIIEIIKSQHLDYMSRALFLYINSFLLFINIIFTIFLNVYLFKRRRVDDREFKTRYDFYQKLIIDKITDIISPTKAFNQIINEVFDTLPKEYAPDNGYRKVIEDGCNKVDNVYETFVRDNLPLIKCYSNPFSKKLSSQFEELYDNVVLLVTQAQSNADGSNRIKILSKYSKKRGEYLDSLFLLIDEHKPTL